MLQIAKKNSHLETQAKYFELSRILDWMLKIWSNGPQWRQTRKQNESGEKQVFVLLVGSSKKSVSPNNDVFCSGKIWDICHVQWVLLITIAAIVVLLKSPRCYWFWMKIYPFNACNIFPIVGNIFSLQKCWLHQVFFMELFLFFFDNSTILKLCPKLKVS